jgi:hypothetical protein
MSDVVERAKADIELWGRTPCVEIRHWGAWVERAAHRTIQGEQT